MCVFLLFGLLGACLPNTEHDGVCVDDLVLRIQPNPIIEKYNREHPRQRVYEVDIETAQCYDGDTCTFDVKLPSAGVYDVNGPWDYGLGFIVERPAAPSTWELPLVQRKNQHVRLCDINAPELHPGNPPAAVKARDDLIKWIRASKKVHLHVPQSAHGDMVEKYGRLLVYVYADDVNLNEKQLKHGNAKPFIQCK